MTEYVGSAWYIIISFKKLDHPKMHNWWVWQRSTGLVPWEHVEVRFNKLCICKLCEWKSYTHLWHQTLSGGWTTDVYTHAYIKDKKCIHIHLTNPTVQVTSKSSLIVNTRVSRYWYWVHLSDLHSQHVCKHVCGWCLSLSTLAWPVRQMNWYYACMVSF